MHSMTGYGRGETLVEGTRFLVELQSVNRKQSDIALSLPRSLQSLEGPLRERLQSAIARGRLNVSVSVECPTQTLSDSAINEPLAAAYAEAMGRLKHRLQLAGEVTLEAVLRSPGVLQSASRELDPAECLEPILQALQKALAGLLHMRAVEGAHLRVDLCNRLALLRALLEKVRSRAPQLASLYRQTLWERIRTAGLELPLDDERLNREIVLFADRSDISEELTRLASHTEQFEALLNSSQPVGRTLEFLTQEISREYNTLSTKSNDAQISQWIVESKAELEKIREQLQNIE